MGTSSNQSDNLRSLSQKVPFHNTTFVKKCVQSQEERWLWRDQLYVQGYFRKAQVKSHIKIIFAVKFIKVKGCQTINLFFQFTLYRKVSFVTASRKTSKASLAPRKTSAASLNVRKLSSDGNSYSTSRGNTLASCGSYNIKGESDVSQCSMLVNTSGGQ